MALRRVSHFRADGPKGEDQSFTYGEVELPSFLEILRLAGAKDGQIFVDLVNIV
jgi:hypothetical protein